MADSVYASETSQGVLGKYSGYWGVWAVALASPCLGRDGMMQMSDSVQTTSAEQLAAKVDHRLRLSLGLTVVGVVTIFLTTASGFWQTLGLGLFYLLLPSLAVAQLPLLRVHEIERIPMYIGSAGTIVIIGAVALGFGVPSSGMAGLGIFWIPGWEMAAWVGGITITGLAIIGAFWPAESRSAGGPSDFVLKLIPRTGLEKRFFVGLSIVAGLGEEIAYRGYALTTIQLLIPAPWIAAGLSSVAFGVLHAYQGSVGILRTALIGFVLATSVLMTESLVPGIMAHALIDLIVGLVIGPRMVTRAEKDLRC